MTEIQIIAFDADDTLWVNEPFFRKQKRNFVTCWKIFCRITAFQGISLQLK